MRLPPYLNALLILIFELIIRSNFQFSLWWRGETAFSSKLYKYKQELYRTLI